jgi:hypothetical protein
MIEEQQGSRVRANGAQQRPTLENDLRVGGDVTSKVDSEDPLSARFPQQTSTKGRANYFIIGLIAVGAILAVAWGAFLVHLFIKLLFWLARWI